MSGFSGSTGVPTRQMDDAIAQSAVSTGNIHGSSPVSDTTTQTLVFTADGGQKVRMTIAKLGDNRNYVQFWLGDTQVDRGYIIFDVSRNNT